MKPRKVPGAGRFSFWAMALLALVALALAESDPAMKAASTQKPWTADGAAALVPSTETMPGTFAPLMPERSRQRRSERRTMTPPPESGAQRIFNLPDLL